MNRLPTGGSPDSCRSDIACRVAACAAYVVVAVAMLLVGARVAATQDERVGSELERSVTRGLEHLARTQQADGSWPGQHGRMSGVVGLAMLAFLAHGDLPDEGKYGLMIRRGVDYIVSHQESNGLLSGEDKGSPMYNHGFATLALAEVYGMIDNPRVGPALKRAVGLIVSSQNSQGGWRYNVGSTDADTTVSAAQMIALRAAANAGIEVPVDTIRRGVAYYKSCFCPGGGFGYQGPSDPNHARSGIGLLVLSLSGEYRSSQAKATADWLLARGPLGAGADHFYYACYYCSQAMFQAGGKYWRWWNETMTPALISMQKPDGSWPPGRGGPVCDTAFALLAMEVNYGFLPIYQR